MVIITRGIFIIAMVVLGIVSMWTTYVSVHDSILPTPEVNINLGQGVIWECSVFALLLAIAIGLMLFALKLAIIDEQKRLNILGVIGLITVGFISISFNLDVLYRMADRDFFLRFSNAKMLSVYESYLTETQAKLIDKRDGLLKQVAKQEGELDAEIRGLRQAPQGYGRVARQEDYQLTLLQKTTQVELDSVQAALEKKEEADTLLRAKVPGSIEEIEQLQNELRVVVKDIGAVSGVPLPETVRTESPLFAVFQKLFDWRTVGIKEVFFVILALLLDLSDIVGYSLVPNKPKKAKQAPLSLVPELAGAELVTRPQLEQGEPVQESLPLEVTSETDASPPPLTQEAIVQRHVRRPFRFRRG